MSSPIVIIGSGIAGLYAALKCSSFQDVLLITKDSLEDSNTYFAQGGLAAVFGHDDTIETHVQDTLRAGDGLSDKRIARILAEETPKRIRELDSLGVPFNKEGGSLKLSREAVHSRARIVHCSDITGRVVANHLINKVRERKRITIKENMMALDLLMEQGRCVGCMVLDIQESKKMPIAADSVVLATGGIGQAYEKTTNPKGATGDGIAMAYRAGAKIEDMEFVQFHPTMLFGSEPSFLISETLRGEGGLLKNKYGKSYMGKYHRDGELAPRDVVSKFSVIEMQETGADHVYLDMTHMDAEYLRKRFPNIDKECLRYGIDMTKDMIPVSPAAHYLCGGIKTDSWGRTTIKGLYAIGECACTGLHGADRLASNSLTEGLVFGKRLSDLLHKESRARKTKIAPSVSQDTPVGESNGKVAKLRSKLQEEMWQRVGIIRNKDGLRKACLFIGKLQKEIEKQKENGASRQIAELENMCTVAALITIACLRRKESRGTHFFVEYPVRYDNIWQTHLSLDKSHPKLIELLGQA